MKSRLSVIEVIEVALRDSGIKKEGIGVISNSIVDCLEAMDYEIILREKALIVEHYKCMVVKEEDEEKAHEEALFINNMFDSKCL